MRAKVAVLSVMLAVAWSVAPTRAQQGYPAKPIELVVPFSAGGGSDILARHIARAIQDEKLLPEPLVVVNKPGGSGAVGYSYVAGKRGDPYTMATVSSSFWTTPLVGQSPVTYQQFTAVAGLAYDTFLLLVGEKSRFRTVKEVVEAAKASPKSIAVGGSSAISDDAVVTYILQKETGIELNFIPFRGGGDVMTALLGGQVALAWANPAEAMGQIEGKLVRPLAVASEARLKGLPHVPTFKELGVDLVFRQLRGLVMPAGVPAEAVKVVEAAILKMSETKAWREGYVDRNMLFAAPAGSAEFARLIETTNEMYRRVFTDLGVAR